MRAKKFRSPQEKKKLSYEKDRRNTYGESSGASRQGIPPRKKLANRKIRKADKSLLLEDWEAAENKRSKMLAERWQKISDDNLVDFFENRARYREKQANRFAKIGN